ncbi:M23 family metallopeptidase [Curtobacterium sp. L6-1]|uniref:M23 family metallopeptidase n=2 Tax=Curtobacterium aetherium TaxID=2841594 RepID=A0ACD1E5S2_9MICO|nr:M23 family metallopeptidase [Curtobacterium sp. L6-1]
MERGAGGGGCRECGEAFGGQGSQRGQRSQRSQRSQRGEGSWGSSARPRRRRAAASGRVAPSRRWLGRRRSPVGLSVAAVLVAVLVAVLAALPVAGAVAGPAPTAAAEPPGRGAGAASTPGGSARSREVHWDWPTRTRVVQRPWEAPTSDYGPGHRGLDVAAPPGTPVVAPDAGTIAFAGPVGGRSVVTVDHGDGLVSTLDPVEPTVRKGDPVERGQRVGTAGPGHCASATPCLHLGARVDGRYVDPLPFLTPAEWPVLLPDGTAGARAVDRGRRRPGRVRAWSGPRVRGPVHLAEPGG